MKKLLILLLFILGGCNSGTSLDQKIETIRSLEISSNTRVSVCLELADFPNDKVINVFTESLYDDVLKGCATRSLLLNGFFEPVLVFIKENAADETVLQMSVRFGSDEFLTMFRATLTDIKARDNLGVDEMETINLYLGKLKEK